MGLNSSKICCVRLSSPSVYLAKTHKTRIRMLGTSSDFKGDIMVERGGTSCACAVYADMIMIMMRQRRGNPFMQCAERGVRFGKLKTFVVERRNKND